MKRGAKLSLGLSLALMVLPACGDDEPTTAVRVAPPTELPGETPEADRLRASLRELERQLADAAGAGSCGGSEACRVLPLGSKPCGGPERYLVYSSDSADSARMLTLGERHRDLDRRLDDLIGGVSDCVLVTTPTPACDAGTCRDRP